MAVRFNSQDIKFVLKEKRRVASWVKRIAQRHNKIVGELSIIFVNDSFILSINKQYLNHNYFTDIITFDYSVKNFIEGDIFISIDTVKSNSEKFCTSFNNELLRVIAHGVLHLLGFKDKEMEEQEEMRRNEDLAIKLFYDEQEE